MATTAVDRSSEAPCDARRAGTSELADLHDRAGHHRNLGSSVESGSERIVESRRGKRASVLAVFGFSAARIAASALRARFRDLEAAIVRGRSAPA
ncbi:MULTISPECIES: hypothetical protein [unclassified Bradyrhizobium]